MPNFLNLRIQHFFLIAIFALTSCKTIENLPGGNAREISPDPRERVKKNLEEGRGFRLDNLGKSGKGGDFMFASANELWRASLDTLDFMPLSSVNYSGGIIITDWYSTSENQIERCKLNIFISGKSLNTENLKVTSFCQEFNNQIWVNKKIEKENNKKIENAILNKAKKLRLQSS